MGNLFDIVPITNTKKKKTYPYKIKFPDGKAVPIPDQYKFSSDFIRTHGCIIAAFYMGLRFVGVKKSMQKCLKYLQENQNKGNHINYCLKQVADSINKIATGNPAKFYKNISKAQMKKALKNGHMILFTEKNPVHTAVILWNGRKFKRFSNGKYKTVTVNWEIKKRYTNDWYGGCVVVKKLN